MYWWQSVEQALENLGGSARLKELYVEVGKVRVEHGDTTPVSLQEVVRKELEYNSSDSSNWRETRDLFFSVHGIGNGVWGLRSKLSDPPLATDLTSGDQNPSLSEQTTTRVIRDTVMARKIKVLHAHSCQICGETISLQDGQRYAEAHHLIPLGTPHRGPDTPENILIVCPNHHAMLDFGCITLAIDSLKAAHGHTVSRQSIDYHNTVVFKAST